MASAAVPSSAPNSVLLWKIGALGDVLMTTPLVRQLRAQLPHARIDYLVGRGARAVLADNPHLDAVREFDERILFGAQVHRLAEVLALLRGYERIYVLDKHWIFGWLARAAGIPQRVGFRRRAAEGWPHTLHVDYGSLRHEIDYYLDLAEASGLPVDRHDRTPALPPAEPFPLPRPYVVAINSGGNNPGETSEVRKLPAPLFASLVQALSGRAPVVFLGSRAESAGYEALAARYGARNLCGRTSLRQAWDVLAHADAIYTTDTGLMHMAGVCNAHVVAVFGPTHPLRKCPPGVRWVWRDEDRYDPRYDSFGTLLRARYFERMTVADIVESAHPGSLDRRQNAG